MHKLISNVDKDESEQLEILERFASAVESAIKNESNRVKSEMKKWTDSLVRRPINEMEKFKAKVENMPIVDFVNERTKLLNQANKLSSLHAEDFVDT